MSNQAPFLPKPPTAERLVRSAMRLFSVKGYGSTSVSDILHEAGANSGSLYHAFPTKQDLLLAVLQTYRDGIWPMLLDPAWQGIDDPIERIFALLAGYRKALTSTDCTFGCPIGSLALEIHEPDPPVREMLAANFDAWVAAIEGCLDQAQDRLPVGTDTHALAQFVLTVMEGGVMQSRTHRTLETYDASVAVLADYFARLQAASANPDPTES
jgi:TetR/AcrR family transcriptional repressor of nem operon